MKILVVEWSCAQNEMDQEALPIRDEGKAMLEALLEDMVSTGADTMTIARDGLLRTTIKVENFSPLSGEPFIKTLRRSVPERTGVFIIAPEANGVLLQMTRNIESLGFRNLGCSADSVELCADKLRLFSHWRSESVPTPETWLNLMDIRDSGPFIVKPRDGCGCVDTVVVENYSELRNQMDELIHQDTTEFIIQKLMPGIPASISCIISDEKTVFMPACGQSIQRIGNRLEYKGGWGPLPEEMIRRAEILAAKALGGIRGLGGWVGVDMVLGDPKDGSCDYAIEINPRLTSSYLGIRHMKGSFAAAAIARRDQTSIANQKIKCRSVIWSKTGHVITN